MTTATTTERVTAGVLLSFIERFESLEVDRKDIVQDQKEVMAEAKSRGFDTKVLRKIITARQKTKDQRAEEDAVFQLYAKAIGM